MLSYKKNTEFSVAENEITPSWAYMKRRTLMQGGALGAMAWWAHKLKADAKLFKSKMSPEFSVVEAPSQLTKKELALSYNNFYEFSLDKDNVADRARDWKIDSWKLDVSGLVEKPRTLNLKDLTTAFDLEERIYRFRCVEAWSMVVPWIGFPLSKLIESVKPKADAKFVRFVSLMDRSVMPGIDEQKSYPWPYHEGLTIEEAKSPLSLLVVGAYGEPLAKQNGAPIRLVVPWKYGFKSIKSLVKIEFVKEQPGTFWNKLASKEYGFYANVNPKVDHPRWSQASERVVDGGFFPKRNPTRIFNGYEKYVTSLYSGLDLAKNY